MKQEGAILQTALFENLQNDEGLMKRYAPIAEADVSPQFSYDGIRSQWVDRSVALSRHLVEFSVWHAQAAFADGDIVAASLIDRLLNISLDAPYKLVHMRLQLVETGFDATNRLWRQRLDFEALMSEAAV